MPSKIAKQLKNKTGKVWRIKNYARGYYYSSQELNLLAHLLRTSSKPPGFVIFIDGLNDCYHLVGSTFIPTSQLADQDQIAKFGIGFANLTLKVV